MTGLTRLDVTTYFWYTFILLYIFCTCFCNKFLWPLHFGWHLVLSLHKEDYLLIFKCVSFWLHGFCGKWEDWVPINRFNYTNWMSVVTRTDRPKSVRNRCVIEVFGGVFVLSIGFWIFCLYRGFRHRSESDLLRFIFISNRVLAKCTSWLISFALASKGCKERNRDLQNEQFCLPTAGLELTAFGLWSHYRKH